MIRTDQAVFLGRSDVAAIVGKINTELEFCTLAYRTRAGLSEILAIIEHAQGKDESAPLTQERLEAICED